MATLGRLMSPELPESIEPLRLARAGKSISGQLPVSRMQRLLELLHDDSGVVSFNLAFGRDKDEKTYCITGTIETVLNSECQRCLEQMAMQLDVGVSLGIVTTKEEADSLDDKYEPFFPEEDDSVMLAGMIEDELLLAIPISPMHAANVCNATPILDELQETSRNRPFAELDKLAQKQR